ncbi:hypothetical protein ABZ863_28645 [Saccharomonospora sp. NPDC046836]|uniref:hypothetical protein n=1 Tax=Saccharomonospora sp. NPDC046836 TaxID=3156921 RepID=UPI0033F22AF8
MTQENEPKPAADVSDQQRPAAGGAAEQLEPAMPLEADPADVAEQAVPVSLDEDDDHRR